MPREQDVVREEIEKLCRRAEAAEAKLKRAMVILTDLFEDAGGGFPKSDWSINPGLNSVQALIRFMREGR